MNTPAISQWVAEQLMDATDLFEAQRLADATSRPVYASALFDSKGKMQTPCRLTTYQPKPSNIPNLTRRYIYVTDPGQ